MASVPDWVWIVSGWCAVAFGASGVLFGRLWWRRRRGSVRVCGKCGYDMARLASMTCPECGRVGKSERDLRPRRSRKRWRVAGAVVLLGAWCLLRAPAMRVYGWAAGVPGWALLVLAPTEVDAATVDRLSRTRNQVLAALWLSSSSPPSSRSETLLKGLRNDMYVELWRRIEAEQFPVFVIKWHLRRVLPAHLSPGRGIAAPTVWPHDQPIDAQSEWAGAASVPERVRTEYRIDQTARREVERDVMVAIGSRFYGLYTLRSPIDAHMSTEEFMGPVSSPEMDAQFARAYRPRAWAKWSCLWVEFPAPALAEDLIGLPQLMAVAVRVRIGDELLGAGTCELTDAFVQYHGSMFASMKWIEGGQARALANLNDVKIEIAGSPAGAFYKYKANPKIERRAWAGRVMIEPEVMPRD